VSVDLCDFESNYLLPCMGDIAIDGVVGDLEITISIKKQKTFKKISNDIYANLKINLIQFIYGHIFMLELPDGTNVPVTVVPLKFEKQVLLPGFGLPYYDHDGDRCRGDCIVDLEFDVSSVDPAYIDDVELRSHLETRFKK
jgi:DnaJ-class molecular chaperone